MALCPKYLALVPKLLAFSLQHNITQSLILFWLSSQFNVQVAAESGLELDSSLLDSSSLDGA